MCKGYGGFSRIEVNYSSRIKADFRLMVDLVLLRWISRIKVDFAG